MKPHRTRGSLLATPGLVLLGLVLPAATATGAQANVREALEARIEELVAAPNPTVAGEPIVAAELISRLYEQRGYKPAWTNQKMFGELLDQIGHAVDHGLTPDDYHYVPLAPRRSPARRGSDPESIVDTEILSTDALARLAVSLHYGKLDPASLDQAWNFSRRIGSKDPVELVGQVLARRNVATWLDAVAPQNEFYRWFQAALVEYRSIQAHGGWPQVPDGPLLEVGARGPRVETLRRRLRASGDLAGATLFDPTLFDAALEEAVKRFQQRHGIDTDGKIGPRSLEALNVPVAERIGQLRASLERMRWVFRDIPDDYLIVDIAGFHAYLTRNRKRIWSTRVQVGREYHESPIFKDTVRYIEFNPTWTIPSGILRKEILPTIRRDPEYLSTHDMSVVSATGEIVDPSTIDWAATAGKRFPYRIRQEPGPDNALGRVKFMFPNKYMVYLHDTPSKSLFAHSERAFSHGCIRTQKPLELATLLLQGQGWNRSRIDEVLASRKTTRVDLEPPLTVMLLYWTAEADAEGTVFFRKDVYHRDAPILAGLDEPFRLNPPAGAREAVEGLAGRSSATDGTDD